MSDIPNVTAAPEIVVSAAVIPGTMHRHVLPAGSTVADVLRTADLDATGMQVRVGGELVAADDLETRQVQDGERVLLSRQIKGN